MYRGDVSSFQRAPYLKKQMSLRCEESGKEISGALNPARIPAGPQPDSLRAVRRRKGTWGLIIDHYPDRKKPYLEEVAIFLPPHGSSLCNGRTNALHVTDREILSLEKVPKSPPTESLYGGSQNLKNLHLLPEWIARIGRPSRTWNPSFLA